MTKKFDDVYFGATVVANLMKINADTLRKRAKAGKVPAIQNAKGKWTFVTAELAKAGIEPFASGYKPTATAVKKLTDVVFVLDRSGSMGGLYQLAIKNLQGQIDELRKAAGHNDKYRVSVINFNDNVDITSRGCDVLLLEGASKLYRPPGGSTKLYDAVLEAVALCKTLDTGDAQHAFLISVVTDGDENASTTLDYLVSRAVREVTASDRYTFAYAGPKGSKKVAAVMGIPDGNATEWEQTTYGASNLGLHTNSSLSTYTRSRSIGARNSVSFYAAPVTNDANKFAGQLDNKLDDVSSQVKVERVTSADPIVISKFCDKKFGSFPKGKVYYQLTESEKVQDYKKLIVQDTTTGNFFAGDQAKKLLSIPNFTGTVRIKPGKLGEFKVFVQSTSMNRKLTPGTAVVYLP